MNKQFVFNEIVAGAGDGKAMVAERSRSMETRDHSRLLSVAEVKNGVSPKDQMSRENFLTITACIRVFLFFIVFCFGVTSTFAQDTNERIARHFKRAETAYQLGKRKDAIKEYEQVMDLNANNKEAYINAAIICEEIPEPDFLKLAIKYYKNYMSLAPTEQKDISKKIYELEYLVEKYSIIGVWKTTTGNFQPNCRIKISPFKGGLRVELLPNSNFYSKRKFNAKVVYFNLYDSLYYNDEINFTFVKEKHYVPLFAKWKILSAIGSSIAAGSVDLNLGSGASAAIESAGDIASEAGREANRGWIKEKFYEFNLYENDESLTGYMQYYVRKTKHKTHSTKILYDEIVEVKFVRAPDYYDRNKAYKTYGKKWNKF